MKPNDAWRQHAMKPLPPEAQAAEAHTPRKLAEFEDNDYGDPNPYEEVLRAAAYIIGGCLAGGMFAMITGWVIGYWGTK